MSDASTHVLTILMTAPDAEVGERIVARLLDERLIACGNVVPGAVSLYRWEGEVQRDSEAVVFMKTVSEKVAAALDRAQELHPYEVPELLVHRVVAGSPEYLEWVENECR